MSAPAIAPLKRARSTGSEENESGSDISCSYQFTLVHLENEKEDLEKELFDLKELKKMLELGRYTDKMSVTESEIEALVSQYLSAEGEMKDFYKVEIKRMTAKLNIYRSYAESLLKVYSRIDAIYERKRSINSEILLEENKLVHGDFRENKTL